jgi:hypothetical protein
MKIFAAGLLIGGIAGGALLLACPPPSPLTPGPDATDAVAPPPATVVDSTSPPLPDAAVSDGRVATMCEVACALAASLGCKVAPNCAVVLQKANDRQTTRAPDGFPLSCARIEMATSLASLQQKGMTCLP